MIVFDLECTKGHCFEGWFDSIEAFEEQNHKGLVSCPVCGDIHVRRVLSPVALKKGTESAVHSNNAPEAIDYRRLAKEIVKYVQENFEDVGPKFASEALKMHYGVTEKRNIRGSATEEEEKILKEEGVEFFKIPFPKKDDKKTN
ncbi:MAG: DUF1178 family protein [Deltaproteobacteria bacterium]|nr:DUF1178 family protein [Deltaproteobacteria bacterium]MBW1927796.1 DUF1178 family protein [Deltaproteobacteria bacterium]MBW2024105.1 DUF1178 family protein [Deltaproteobacteria bacterium]MBW2124845.1 DUF1178 family protein [Deltaproteobacteria bacterium]RLB14225.1 MAG: DUF1178 domain-containing protein [Deltaproteobacteria bacterium]